MRSPILSAALALATTILATPIEETLAKCDQLYDKNAYMKGFKNPIVQPSVGDKALCVSGTVDITASSNNVNFNIPGLSNQVELTEFLLELFQVNSTLTERVVAGRKQVGGTYSIYSQLCFPKATGTINDKAIQFLIHGAGLDRTYWNVAPGYSYVDYAAEQGYTTFLYDRLGTGLSDHPDPIQDVQVGLQVEIAHKLVQLLRAGGLSSNSFKQVVGVGHSLGSYQVLGLTNKYPKDLDAAVFTGFSPDESGKQIAFAGLDSTVASELLPQRFPGLAPGYLTSGSLAATQFFFFRAPGFDPALLRLADKRKYYITLGEILTTASAVSPSFTGPIDVVNGENDLPNCHGNCWVPENKAAAVKDAFFPAASNGSDWYLLSGAGHGLNLHYGVLDAYAHIQNFIKKNGF